MKYQISATVVALLFCVKQAQAFSPINSLIQTVVGQEEEPAQAEATTVEVSESTKEPEYEEDPETGLLTLHALDGTVHVKDEEGNEFITNADGITGSDIYVDGLTDTWTFDNDVYHVITNQGYTYDETDYSMEIVYDDGTLENDYWDETGDYWGENNKEEYWFYSGDGCLSIEWKAMLVTYNNCDKEGNKYGHDSVGNSWWDAADGSNGWYLYADGNKEEYTISADGSEVGTDSQGGRFFYGKDGSGVYSHGNGEQESWTYDKKGNMKGQLTSGEYYEYYASGNSYYYYENGDYEYFSIREKKTYYWDCDGENWYIWDDSANTWQKLEAEPNLEY